MKVKKVTALLLSMAMAFSMAACGASQTADTASRTADTSSKAAGTASSASGSAAASEVTGTVSKSAKENDNSSESGSDTLNYTGITLGEDTNLTATIKMLTNRTDMMKDDYSGTNWKQFVAKFNEMYPNITVNVEGVTDYAQDSLTRLQGGDWGDIMLIPAINKVDLDTYFCKFGSLEDVSKQVNFASAWAYKDQVYGIPTFANANGIVYNKKVFENAGITSLPKTPDEFIADLKAIKEKEPDVIPLYTNYSAGWTMGAWDSYIWGGATGDPKYKNQEIEHIAAPFSDPGDGTHAYNVYKILYEAVRDKLVEDDYTTTDWEGSKGMLNSGAIGCMVLGSWSYEQMKQGGDRGEDVGYMPFPITVNGKQYATTGSDYCFGVNVKSNEDNKKAAAIFIKWMTEKSGWSYEGGGLPINAGDTNYPEVYKSFIDNNVEFVQDEAPLDGEEDLLNLLNTDSELELDAGGNDKNQQIVEAAATGSQDFDSIMDDWNQKWNNAQKTDDVKAE